MTLKTSSKPKKTWLQLATCREAEKVRDALSYEEPYRTQISEGDLYGRTECSSVY